MKRIRLLSLAALLLVASGSIADARGVRIWTYQELLDKSDLAVLATPAATNDTNEHIDLPGFPGEHVVGVETRFNVSAVLKGDKTLKDFVLHHYRTADGANFPHVDNGPTFVHFPPATDPVAVHRTYILFLVREADGRYAPAVGQTDPGLSVKELQGVYHSGVEEIQTKLTSDLTTVLKECQTIKPGMTRAELSKVFSTEGGLSTITHRTYVYRDCPYVKVDVDFSLSGPGQREEKPTDIVTKISKPYLGWSVID